MDLRYTVIIFVGGESICIQVLSVGINRLFLHPFCIVT